MRPERFKFAIVGVRCIRQLIRTLAHSAGDGPLRPLGPAACAAVRARHLIYLHIAIAHTHMCVCV